MAEKSRRSNAANLNSNNHPRQISNRSVPPLSGPAEDSVFSQLECELQNNLRRAREYELENANAAKQDIQRKVQHVLLQPETACGVPPVAKRKEQRDCCPDYCHCDVIAVPASSATPVTPLDRQGTERKIRRVFVANSCPSTEMDSAEMDSNSLDNCSLVTVYSAVNCSTVCVTSSDDTSQTLSDCDEGCQHRPLTAKLGAESKSAGKRFKRKPKKPGTVCRKRTRP